MLDPLWIAGELLVVGRLILAHVTEVGGQVAHHGLQAGAGVVHRGVLGSIGCGDDGAGNSCIDAGQSRFCRVMPRVQACCGDALCEGAEDAVACGLDCLDTDSDGFTDITDSDDDNDGLPDTIEALGGSNSLLADTDGDGLVDGADGAVPVGAVAGGVDADGDGFVDGEQDFGSSATNPDSDGDRLDDGLEVSNGANPTDPNDWPNLADGDLAPLGAPDGQLNTGDLADVLEIQKQLMAPSP